MSIIPENDSSFRNNDNNWTWSIPNFASSHTSSGYWGPIEANHAFCEPHYMMSPYIVEWFNCTSSIIYILLALTVSFPKDVFLNTAARGWLVLVGVGSMLFHGTMRYIFQLSDEIPMVGFLSTLMIAKLAFWNKNKTRMVAITLVMLFGVGLLIVYVVLDQYEVFIHGFAVMVLIDTVLTISLLDSSARFGKVEVRAYLVSLVAIVLGRIAWELEHLLCFKYPQVWPLHVVWHFFSCLSAYAAMVTVYVIRARKNYEIQCLPRFVGFVDLISVANKATTKED
jgi:dihydroceramidase